MAADLLKLIPSTGSVRLCDGPIQVGGATLGVRFELGRTKTGVILGDLYVYRPERTDDRDRITLVQTLYPSSGEFGSVATEVAAIPRGLDLDVGYRTSSCGATQCSDGVYIVATVAGGSKKELVHVSGRDLTVNIRGARLTAEWAERGSRTSRRTQQYEVDRAGYRLVSDHVWCVPFRPPTSVDVIRGLIRSMQGDFGCGPTLTTSNAFLQARLEFQLTTVLTQDLTLYYAAAPFPKVGDIVRYEVAAPAYVGEWLWLVAVLPTQDERVFDLAYQVGHCSDIRCGGGHTLTVLDLDGAKPAELLRVDAPTPIEIEADPDLLTLRWSELRQGEALCCPSLVRTRVYDRVRPHVLKLKSDTTVSRAPDPTPLPKLSRP